MIHAWSVDDVRAAEERAAVARERRLRIMRHPVVSKAFGKLGRYLPAMRQREVHLV